MVQTPLADNWVLFLNNAHGTLAPCLARDPGFNGRSMPSAKHQPRRLWKGPAILARDAALIEGPGPKLPMAFGSRLLL